jgi:hypothetical protein
MLPMVKNAKLELPVDSCDPASPQQFNFQESHWGEDDHSYPYAHQYSNERSAYIYDVNNDDWYNHITIRNTSQKDTGPVTIMRQTCKLRRS